MTQFRENATLVPCWTSNNTDHYQSLKRCKVEVIVILRETVTKFVENILQKKSVDDI